MTDDERIAAIRQRAEAATPGPWEMEHIDSVVKIVAHDGTGYEYVYWSNGYNHQGPTDADAEFIAHAREDIPWLLAEVERLKACVDDAVPRIARLMSEVSGKSGELKPRRDRDLRLADALRASGVNSADALAVQSLYATAGSSGSHRIVSAMRAIGAWIKEEGCSDD